MPSLPPENLPSAKIHVTDKERRTINRTQSRTTILFGFGVIIVILISLVATLLLHINQSTEQLKKLTTLQRAGVLVLEMRQAASQRNIDLLRMTMNDDPFDREQLSRHFYEHATEFVLAQYEFDLIPMTPGQRDTWNLALRSVKRNQMRQSDAVDALLVNQNPDATPQMVNELIPLQSNVTQWMSLLLHDIQIEVQLLTAQTTEATKKAFLVMSILGFIGVLTASGIAFYVLRTSSRVEQALISSRQDALSANQFKSQFLANMSHEIRTPLTAIIGFGETLLDTRTSTHDRVDSINAIIRNGTHLQQIINDILDLSKIEANKLDVERIDTDYFEVLAEIHSVVGMQASSKGLGFEIDYRLPLPARILTDPLRLTQILINLCNNAIKFTERGSVRVVVSYLANGQMQFDVVDTGIGLTAEQSRRLFQPFEQADSSTTRKYGGSGLGLVISRRLAEMLGGTITVDGVAGEGSRFTVTIDAGPLQSSGLLFRVPTMLADIPATELSSIQLTGQVLLAEDTRDNQRLFSRYINSAGAQVTVVDNGQLAVEAALRDGFDIILMDMQMPVMGGIEAVKILRSAGYKKPIVALTANAMKEDQKKCFAAGCDEFLTKPLKREALLQMLARYLKPKPSEDNNQPPINSMLLEREPDMKDLVISYLNELPAVLQQAKDALAQQKWPELQEVIHSLKGTGGGFGYPMLTNLAEKIELQIAKGDRAEIHASIVELSTMCHRICDGGPPA